MKPRAAMLAAAVAVPALLASVNALAPAGTGAPGGDAPNEDSPHGGPQPPAQPEPDTIVPLSDDDFEQVAARLGVEAAAIKAVVEIEAGSTHEGFSAPGVPLINFDLTMFRRFATRRGVNLAKYSGSHPVVFSSHKGSQRQANRRLASASTINRSAAIEGTFWGMFQIGGFNWKKCGAASLDDFVERMSRSERDQLEMFADFITSTGLLKHLQAKNWAAFARGYNGPAYARRAYHTRMAAAYGRHKRAEAAGETAPSGGD